MQQYQAVDQQTQDIISWQQDNFDRELRAIPTEPAKDLKDGTERSVDEGEGPWAGQIGPSPTD